MMSGKFVITITAMVLLACSVPAVSAIQSPDPFAKPATGELGQPQPVKPNETLAAAKAKPFAAHATSRLQPTHEQILNAETEHKLVSTIVQDMVYPQIPFSEVMLELRAKYQILVLMDDSATDDALDHDTIIDINLANLSLEQALEILLRAHNATYIVRAGIVHIISMDSADDPEYFETRLFDCRELTNVLPAKLSQYVPARKKDDETGEAVDTRTTLEKLVMENIQADSWSLTGTGDATVREINGKLMVRNSGQANRETRRFLEYLKAELVADE